MEKNIKEAISIIEDVRKSMPECANKAFLNGALNELNQALQQTDVKSFSPVSPAVAWGILAVRDALVIGDSQEAYHQLYMLASPNFDKRSDEVWSELEAIAVEKII
jgi:hypothetical protein